MGLSRLAGLAALALVAALAPAQAALRASDTAFPSPAGLEPQVSFWVRVYTEITSDQGFIHDRWHLGVAYEAIDIDPRPRTRRRQVKQRKAHWRKVLNGLAHSGTPASTDARRALELWTRTLGRAPTPKELRRAANELRFQLGQRDRFRDGLIRAGAYESDIRRVLRRRGLPEDLAYLPHVESSFQPKARSKSGAAGMWQFMPSTGRLYLTIDAVLDERMDPHRSTIAAARLLADNYAKLGTWPLAITAYNHGAGGMRRAKKAVGTSDIEVIVKRHRSRRFGFASRNFYAQFLAARRVAQSERHHFGALAKHRPALTDEVVLPFYVDIEPLGRSLGVRVDTIAALNPSLRASVRRSQRYVPRGFTLRLPKGTVSPAPDVLLAQIPDEYRQSAQRRARVHVVRRGDTLSGIARLHGTSVGNLVALNGLRSSHRIYPGQKIELVDPPRRGTAAPAKRTRPTATVQVAAASRPAKTAPAGPAASGAEVRPVSLPALPGGAHWRELDGEWTRVDYEETLAHFADWLDVGASRLRHLNGLSRRSRLRMGQRLRLDFSKVSEADFQARRAEHHRRIERGFFERHAVVEVVEHTLQPGENLWILSHEVYGVPTWLLHRYNPEAVMRKLTPGAAIQIPVLARTTET